jgi:hypothetical protein
MSTSPLSVRRFQVIFGVCWLVLMADHAMVVQAGAALKEASLIACQQWHPSFLCLILNTLRYYFEENS